MNKVLSILIMLLLFFVLNSTAFAKHHHRYHRYHKFHKHFIQLKISKKIDLIQPPIKYIEVLHDGRDNKKYVYVIETKIQKNISVFNKLKFPESIISSNNIPKKVLIFDEQPMAIRKEDIEGFGSIDIANKYVGLDARTNKKDLIDLFKNTIHQAIDPTITPWCAAFVNAMLSKLGMKGTNSLAAGSFTNWGKKTIQPKKSDIVLLKLNNKPALNGITHVTFYIDTVVIHGTKYVKVLGGNQNHSVKVSYYPASAVVQYRTIS